MKQLRYFSFSVVVLAFALAYCVGYSGSGDARGPSRIAFVTNRDGNDEIYVMNADGTGQTNLTNNSAVDSSPAWRP